MAFDSSYVPDCIDFVMIDDFFAELVVGDEGAIGYYNELLNPYGIQFTSRQIKEADLRSAVKGVSVPSIETLARHSVVFVHGNVKHSHIGVIAGLKLAGMVDSRIIIKYDSSYLNLLFHDVPNLEEQIQLNPSAQISFLETSEMPGLSTCEGSFRQYFEDLAILKGGYSAI